MLLRKFSSLYVEEEEECPVLIFHDIYFGFDVPTLITDTWTQIKKISQLSFNGMNYMNIVFIACLLTMSAR